MNCKWTGTQTQTRGHETHPYLFTHLNPTNAIISWTISWPTNTLQLIIQLSNNPISWILMHKRAFVEMSKTNRYQQTVIPLLSCLVSMLCYPYYIYILQKTCCDVSIVSHEKHCSTYYIHIAVFGAWKQIHHITFFSFFR